MITVTVKHHMSAGHRILGLDGPGSKCANLHGHTFGIEWTFRTDSTDVGAIEFAAVKATLRGWIDEHMDHGYLVDIGDVVLRDFLVAQDLKCFMVSGPPTTERIAATIAHATGRLVAANLIRVTVTEGPHNAATWEAEQ
ncbi:hypothetical protein HH308_06145 [Gordonia sp. TBRC 11910]|uniref:6-carboxy-5,6,7,8-tetrahydropterin synthase n=1 Tax=Gordonia asplenii TaxID=2725283 RepID=A0A848KWF9_9ACTN|nr:6-carboxytetrahydropterin synthase [Gordonia asplenii]NMO00793.1 hypothetical protein [Gordonia asplenii]